LRRKGEECGIVTFSRHLGSPDERDGKLAPTVFEFQHHEPTPKADLNVLAGAKYVAQLIQKSRTPINPSDDPHAEPHGFVSLS
jgi:hypothetical protein